MKSGIAIHTPNSNITKRMYIFLIITASPLLILLAIDLYDTESYLLYNLTSISNSLSTLHSVTNLPMSSIMSAYCKTAPVWAFIFVLFSYKKLHLKTDHPKLLLTKTLILFSILYFGVVSLLAFNNVELSESGRLMRVMSANNYLLTLLFIAIFSVVFIFTTYYVFFIYAFYKTVNSTKTAH